MTNKLSKAQAELLQLMKENPDQAVKTYWSSMGGRSKAYLTKIHYSPRITTVEVLHKLGYLDREQGKRIDEYIYQLSEKAKTEER